MENGGMGMGGMEGVEDLIRIVERILAEEERSHAEREKVMTELLVEVKELRDSVNRTNEILEEILSIIKEARMRLSSVF